jgi:ZipA, C-terminal FtsZ-binding domain
MGTLQIGLAIAGGVVLAAMVAHGTWASRRNLPRQAEPEAQRVEPVAHEPALDPAAESALMLPPVLDKKPLMDPLIDVLAPITLEAPISGEALLQIMPATRRVGSKPFAVEGFNEQTGQWEMPLPGHRYDVLQAGVQLANRSGALNEIEYSEFVVKTQAFADALGGTPEFPEMREEVARARELDSFASEHDAQLSVTLRARNTAWSPGYVQQNAARLGFVAGALPGRMVLPASVPGQPPVLGLVFDSQAALAEDPAHSAIRELSMSLDVAHVDRSEQPFVRMRESVQRLAETMEGFVVDDNGQPLTAQAMDLIGFELEKIYDTLDARELSAGSVLARRLFS